MNRTITVGSISVSVSTPWEANLALIASIVLLVFGIALIVFIEKMPEKVRRAMKARRDCARLMLLSCRALLPMSSRPCCDELAASLYRDWQAVKAMAFTMLALAFAEAFICTFRAPFTVTGNGFFGSWLGLVCAVAVSVPLLPDQLRQLIHPDHADGDATPAAKVVPA